METTNYKSFAPITPEDHAGYVWIAGLYCMTISVLVLATRLWIKKNIFGWDDGLSVAAFVATSAHLVAVFLGLKNGVGGISDEQSDGQHAGRNAAFAADMFFIVALALAKCSVAMFIRRLVSKGLRTLYWACYILVLISIAWAIGSMIGLRVQCSIQSYLADDMAAQCGQQGLRWVLIGTIDALTEACIVLIPLCLVLPLQMPVKLKLQVVSAFLFRLVVAILAIFHAVHSSKASHARHPSLASVSTIICAEAEICWSLVSATIPNLKSFMASFNTGFGQHDFAFTVTGPARSAGYASGKQHAEAIPLKRIVPGRWNVSDGGIHESSSLQSGREPYGVEAVRDQSTERLSVGSGMSEEMIIRKQVIVTIDHGRRSKTGLQ